MKKHIVIFGLLLLASCSKKQDDATPKSSAKVISSFSLNALNPAVTAAINQTAKTISLTVPFGTVVTALVPTIAVSDDASVSPVSGQATDFTNPIQYTVTAADGSTQVYTVTVLVGKSSLKAITAFSFQGLNPAVNCTINDTTKTITGRVPVGIAITALVPAITVSAKATVSPGSGVASNFTKEVDYTVTAEDGSTQVYKVTISQPPAGEVIAAQLIANATYPSTYGVLGHLTGVLHAFGTEVIYPKDTIVTASSSGGVMPSFNYNSNWSDSSARVVPPPAYEGFRDWYTFTGAGSYNDGNTFSSTYSDAGDYAITYNGSDLPFTITYSRSETVVAQTGAKNTFADKITWSSGNLLVNNKTHVIMSGTAAVSIQITINGQVSSYNGTITFPGGATQATLTFGSGTSYPLQW